MRIFNESDKVGTLLEVVAVYLAYFRHYPLLVSSIRPAGIGYPREASLPVGLLA